MKNFIFTALETPYCPRYPFAQTIGDNIGNPLRITECVRLHALFCIGHYSLDFAVVGELGFDSIVETNVLDCHFTNIRCICQLVDLTRTTFPIVSAHDSTSYHLQMPFDSSEPGVGEKAALQHTQDPVRAEYIPNGTTQPSIRTTKPALNPPMSQTTEVITTNAAASHMLESKHAVHA